MNPCIKPVVPKTIFDDTPPGGFGDVWKQRTKPHLKKMVNCLKDLFASVSEDSPTITCALVVDAEVWPAHNRGKCAVSDLDSKLRDPDPWKLLVSRLRTDPAYRRVLAGLSTNLFGMDVIFHQVELIPYETYTFAFPWSYSVQAIARGAKISAMSFVPASLLATTGPNVSQGVDAVDT